MESTGETERDDANEYEETIRDSSEVDTIECQNTDVRQKLLESGVIGRVLNDFMPRMLLQIIYPDKRVSLGDQLWLAQVQTTPGLDCYVNESDPGLFEDERSRRYVTVMTDPNAPDGEYLHWSFTRIITYNEEYGGIVLDSRRVDLVSHEPPRMAGRMIVFTMFTTLESQAIAVPVSRENFSTRAFADMNGFGLPLGATFFYIKRDNEKIWNGGRDKSPTCIRNEGPSQSKIACAIPRTLRNGKIAFELCKPKGFKSMVLPSSVEKQKGDDVENGSTGRREENHSSTCSTAQISCKSEYDNSPGKQSDSRINLSKNIK